MPTDDHAGRRGGRAREPSKIRKKGPQPSSFPDSLRRLVPQALVVAFLAGGTSAFVASDKAVKLSVDGTRRALHTFADDVGELLADEGVTVGAHDLVAPGRDAELTSGDEVVVRRGRLVTLTIDGHRRRMWTTADTVDGALRQLGVRAQGAHLSVSRSSAIPRVGLALDVLTERTVTFMADGRERTIRTNAATVREALARDGLTLRGQDTTSVRPDSFPRDGQKVSVMRITDSRVVREEAIAYGTEWTADASVLEGRQTVVRRGEQGLRRLTYTVRTVNGVKGRPKKIAEETVRAPVTQRVKVGTKQRPRPRSGAEGLNWSALAACESGGRADAVDPTGTYGGLYQFDAATWRSVGGSWRPQDASAQEQTRRAKKLYQRRGDSPWPHCGRRLHG